MHTKKTETKEPESILYEIDDGPLTDEQIFLIRQQNLHLANAKWTRSIFDDKEEEK